MAKTAPLPNARTTQYRPSRLASASARSAASDPIRSTYSQSRHVPGVPAVPSANGGDHQADSLNESDIRTDAGAPRKRVPLGFWIAVARRR